MREGFCRESEGGNVFGYRRWWVLSGERCLFLFEDEFLAEGRVLKGGFWRLQSRGEAKKNRERDLEGLRERKQKETEEVSGKNWRAFSLERRKKEEEGKTRKKKKLQRKIRG